MAELQKQQDGQRPIQNIVLGASDSSTSVSTYGSTTGGVAGAAGTSTAKDVAGSKSAAAAVNEDITTSWQTNADELMLELANDRNKGVDAASRYVGKVCNERLGGRNLRAIGQ